VKADLVLGRELVLDLVWGQVQELVLAEQLEYLDYSVQDYSVLQNENIRKIYGIIKFLLLL
jgi:hypothetical protein